MNNKFLYENINNYIKLKLENQKIQSLTNEKNYRYKIKKSMYKQILSQTGGAKISLDGLNDLVKEFRKIDKTAIKSKLDSLNSSIEELNKLTENTRADIASLTPANIDMVISDGAAFVTSLDTSGNTIKKDVGIKYQEQFQRLDEYKIANLENLRTITDTLNEYKKHYEELSHLDHQLITRDNLQKINKIKEQLDVIHTKVTEQNTKIKVLKEYSALRELGFDLSAIEEDNIYIESSKPSIIFEIYYEKIEKEIAYIKKTEYRNEFLDLYEIKMTADAFDKLPDNTKSIYKLESDFEHDNTYKLKDIFIQLDIKEKVECLKGIDNKCSILKIKNFLNKIFSDDLLESNKEKRVFNSFIKEELVTVESPAPTFPNLGDITNPSDIFMIGGDISKDIEDIGQLLESMSDKKAECEEYNKNMILIANNYNYECMKLMHHNIFMIGVFNNVFLLDNYMVYTHLDIGLVQFYKTIVDNIIGKIKLGIINKSILYFKKYHMVNLQILDFVLNKIATELGTEETIQDYVNIKLSGKNIRYGCLILNFIKNHLLNYILGAESNITIYARINDWGTDKPNPPLFSKEKDSPDGKKYLLVNPEACEREVGLHNLLEYKTNLGDLRSKGTRYKFNEVFESYIKNDTLATCMGLTLNISKSINTGLITYGYSGTGKTYTLFGSSNPDNRVSGLLQSALQVDGVNKISFRIYELYGMGFQYPFYWNDSVTNKINHFIYHYDIELEENKFTIKDVFKISSDNFDNYTEITPSAKSNINVITGTDSDGLTPTTTAENLGFITIDAEQLAKILQNFEKLVSDIDMKRKEGRRIRETPNNPESSRSIIVYDFVLDIPTNSKKSTNFLLIDLPGKEDIEKTFITKYYNLFDYTYNNITTGLPYGITATNYPSYIKMLLLATSLQPLLIPIIDPKNFIIGINNYIIKNKKLIKTLIIQTGELNFNNELSKVNNYFTVTISDNIINIVKTGVNIITWGGENNQDFITATYGIFFMTSVINNNCFDVLNEIVKTIIDQRINSYITINNLVDDGDDTKNKLLTQFKIVKPNIFNKLSDTTDNDKLLSELEKLYEAMNPAEYKKLQLDIGEFTDIKKINSILLKIVQYDYYLTPYEGLYINENIVGIIKYCEGKKNKKFSVEQQNMDLTFENQSSIVRAMLLNKNLTFTTQLAKTDFVIRLNKVLGLSFDEISRKYIKCIKTITESSCSTDSTYNIYPLIKIEYDRYKLNTDNLNDMYKTILNFYEPNRIYRYATPLIQSILGYYLDGGSPRISDFKMFYLVSNNSLEIKCTAQENLLYLTKDFIENITKDV